jgi:hypothetical protein
MSKADPNPPPSGSVAGYVVAANYAGTVPAGVIRSGNDAANRGAGQNSVARRIGFAWQPLSQAGNFVVRAGYGIFFSQPTGQAFFQSVFGAPFSLARLNIGKANAATDFSHPFPEPFTTPDFFPYFSAYSPTSTLRNFFRARRWCFSAWKIFRCRNNFPKTSRGLLRMLTIQEQFQLARDLQPYLQHIFYIESEPLDDSVKKEALKGEFQSFSNGLDISYWKHDDLGILLKK